ncbi:pentatricopeptide repeat-containing protein At3g23020-like [Mangifera indica]|uniref:pentatricopeptide repeat-containing protein At3g23020-like n=1 Tax=Mangifera indica TaxID=29780 RepID=UPI001CFA9FC3|nr:pentatricopeptide repeat-containing protein At3g23020-like [Mangifera indica]
MFVKPQLETSCFQILGTAKVSPPNNIGVSVSVPSLETRKEPINKSRDKKLLQSSNIGVNRKFSRIRKYNNFDSPNFVARETELEKRSFERCPVGEEGENGRVDAGILRKRNIGTRLGDVNTNGKVQAKCSMKWASYGGCIPLMLQALETVNDIDEALKPWEEKISKKERSIILKEQSSWERALEIFEWFKRKGCYEMNVIHYNIMLRILGKAHKWSYIQSLLDEMGSKGIELINSTYGTLIDVYSKGGLKKEAVCWLERMNERGVGPDEVTMGTVVQMYKKAGEFQRAEEFFKKWSSRESMRGEGIAKPMIGRVKNGSETHSCLSSYTYNTLIDTYGKAGQLKEVSETFAQMLREGVVPNTVTFNTLIHIYGNNDQLGEVASLMKKMEELKCPPDTRTYNILIFLHAKHDNINKAASYFSKMKEACLEPDIVSYRTLLYAYSIRHMVSEAEELIAEMDRNDLEIDEYTQSALTRMYIEAGMLEKSWLWFRRFHLAGNMSSEGYSANIDAYGERGHILEAERAFNCCQERRKLTVLEFNVMLKAYGMGNNYDKACQLFDSMEIHGVAPDKCSYNSLIQILAGADLPHTAKPYLRKMQEAGLVSDCIPYCAVISSFVNVGQLEMAERLYEEMIQFNVKPDVVVFGVLINAFADAGNVKEAVSYFDAMRSAGLPANTVIYNSLIKLYTKVGYLKEAQEIYQMLKSLEEHPDVYTSNCMIDLYTERSMVRQAEELFENLKITGDANEFTFAMMLIMYKRNGRFEEATGIAKQMEELGLITELLSYNTVLELYALDGRFKEAVATFKEMINSAVQPNDYTFKSLGAVLMKCGVPKRAVNKLELTRKKDAQSGLQAWMSTLSCVAGVDDDDTDDP